MVLSIEAKQVGVNRWEAYTDNGREKTGRDVVEWAKEGVALGAGEILLTSVDKEGTKLGFDTALVSAVSTAVPVPVIASGGMGKLSHVVDVVKKGQADAVAMASVLHYGLMSLDEIRDGLTRADVSVRLS